MRTLKLIGRCLACLLAAGALTLLAVVHRTPDPRACYQPTAMPVTWWGRCSPR